MNRAAHRESAPAPRPARRGRLIVAALGLLLTVARAGDILRPNAATTAGGSANAPQTTPAGAAGLPAAVAKVVSNSQDLLARTTAALAAVTRMQNAATTLALQGSDSLKPGLPPVPENSYLNPNGLVPASGVPQDLANPAPGETPSLWTGAALPKETAQVNGGVTSSTVTIQQTQQQAILNWQSFNIGRTTSLVFDQSLGGADAGNWIAFNKVGVTGSPAQILGSISAQGQVYVVDPNGIIFGGSAQVNTHALVASSLPINDNLISSGLLDNPDTQFLFSALPIPAGTNGTPAFTPAVQDQFVPVSSGVHALALNVAATSAVTVSYVPPGSAPTALVAGTDYTYSQSTASASQGALGVVTLTPSGLQKASGSLVSVSYTPAGDQYGNVDVQAGARLSAPSNAGNVGGRVMLVGPNVTNSGTLSTPDGQTIIAAGLQVGIDAHPSTDPSLRGLDVFVGAVADSSLPSSATAGVATNDVSALIEAPRADVTIIGSSVNQLGFIDGSTSVSYNGRIDLLAEYNSLPNAMTFDNTENPPSTTPPFVPTSTGVVTLGSGSVTQVIPELSSTATVVGTQLALPSLVDIRGLAIHLASTAEGITPGSAAIVYAPSAGPTLDSTGTTVVSESNTRVPLASGVTLAAGDWIVLNQGANSTNQLLQFVNDQGQVYLDSGATIDVSGTQGVGASVSEDIVAVQLRGTELANSPLQQNGPLRGQTVDVNLLSSGVFDGVPWVGTPIGDTSGYVGLVQHTVGELTTGGGSVSISAGNSVVIQPSATINVSGGWINYAGGSVTTTQVLSGGTLYDISQATPNRVYQGIYTGTTTTTDAKWNVTQASASPLPPGTTDEPGFLQGGNGGSIAVTAPTMALDGEMYGSTIAGPYQRASQLSVATTFGGTGFLGTMEAILGVPESGQLSLSFQGQNSVGASSSPTPPNIVFTQPASGPGSVAPFDFDASMNPADLQIAGSRGLRGAEVDLSPDLVNSDGFGVVSVSVAGGAPDSGGTAAGGNIIVPQSTHLDAQPGGTLALTGANVDVEGSVSAPGGTLSFTALDFSPLISVSNTPAPDPNRGLFTLGDSGSVSTAGLTIDDRATASDPLSLPLMQAGGRLTISAYSADLEPGSVINASGGLDIQPNGHEAFGNGGKVSILVGQDPQIQSIVGGQLVVNPEPGSLGTSLMGYAGPGATGATLTIKAPLIQVGGSALGNGDTAGSGNTLWLNPTDAAGNLLRPDFFSTGGFAGISLIGLGMADTGANPSESTIPPMLPGMYISPGTTNPVTGKLIPTVIAPQVASWMTEPGPGGQIDLAIDPTVLPAGQRAPANLSLQAKGVLDPFTVGDVIARGDLVVSAGVVIETDPQTDTFHGVALLGDTVTELGEVVSPGGTISIVGSSSPTFIFGTLGQSEPLPTVDLGPQSVLNVSGTTVLTPNPQGLRTGTVLPGGTISVSGNIVGEKGAVLDASGWSDTNDAGGLLYVSETQSALAAPISSPVAPEIFIPYVIQSNAGSIDLTGGQELYMDATLKAAAGGPFAQGGNLAVSSGRFYTPVNLITPLSSDVSMVVTGSGPTLPKGYSSTGTAVIGNLVDPTLSDSTGNIVDFGHLSAATLSGAGLDDILVGGTFGSTEFLGSATLEANRSLTVAKGGVISIAVSGTDLSPTVTLEAPYVAIGSEFGLPTTEGTPTLTPGTKPSFGPGTLVVNATDLIDVGNLSLQGIRSANLTASDGDIRGDGTFDIAGTVTLAALQVYPTTAARFSVAAYDYTPSGGTDQPGTVDVLSTDNNQLPQMPLSAGGQLDIYASDINQGGVLRAPIGTINLGWNNPGSSAIDPAHIDQNTGFAVPTTQTLKLNPGSVTTVSGTDSLLTMIPYGINLNGTAWIDPTGNDISAGGVPGKTVVLEGAKVQSLTGSTIDVSGGGNLYAYQWIGGTGGTNDVLSPTFAPNASTPSLTSFAVIPGYQPVFAPYAPYNVQTANSLLGTDPGYVANAANPITPGDQVYLNAAGGLPAGAYTVLPARYALLPGAFLVTPESGAPPASAAPQPDGTTVVSGYSYNKLSPLADGIHPVLSTFTVASGTVVRTESQYGDFDANTFLSTSSKTAGAATPPLPMDGGQLVLSAEETLGYQGQVKATPATGGSGGLVDISTSPDQAIAIGATAPSGDLLLNPADLSNFGAASLLIGGTRQTTSLGTSVSVTAGIITVDNPGTPLTGSDIILAATGAITIGEGSEIEQTVGQVGPSETLLVNGNGALLRVSGDPTAQIDRTGVSGSATPVLSVGSGAQVLGKSVILDSTSQTVLDPSAAIGGSGSFVTLGSGQISIQLAGAGPLRPGTNGGPSTGLVLTDTSLDSLGSTISGLSLLSYSSIDVYGSGTVGSPGLSTITLSSPEIYGDGGNATFAATTIAIKGNAFGSAPDAASAGTALTGSLNLDAATIQLGSGPVSVLQYAALNLNAAAGISLLGSGALSSPGSMTLTTPSVTAPQQAAGPDGTAPLAPANIGLTAGGALAVLAPTSGPQAPTAAGAMGASLDLSGSSVAIDTSVSLSGGSMTAHDTGSPVSGGVSVGSTADIDVGGTSKAFNDLTEYSNSGQILLSSDRASISIASGARLNLAAESGGGNGGELSISAPNGIFTLSSGAALYGEGGVSGKGGVFSLDVSSIPGTVQGSSSVGALGGVLSSAGFTQALDMRLRTGNVLVDGTLRAGTVDLSADNGSISVTGSGDIDASGPTGGTIDLSATGSITLQSGSILTVKGVNYDDAGKGGSVTLDAGAPKNGTMSYSLLGSGPQLSILAGSTIDLSVVNDVPLQLNTSGSSFVSVPANSEVTLATGTPGNDLVTFSSAGTLTTPAGVATAFAAGYTTAVAPGTSVSLASAGTIGFAAGGTGGPIPLSLPASTPVSGSGVANLGEFNASGVLTLEAPQAVDIRGNPVDVQIAPIGGSIVDPSSVVVAGFHVFTPAGGIISTVEAQVLSNGADFAGGMDSTGTLQAGHAAAIIQRLAGGNPNSTALGAVLQVEPGAEIVNSANPSTATTVTLNNNGSSLSVPAGTDIGLPDGGQEMNFSSAGTVTGPAGTITTASGVTTAFGPGIGHAFSAGSTVTLSGSGSVTLDSPGTLTLAGGSGRIPVALAGGQSYSLAGSNGSTVNSSNAIALTLSSSGAGGSSLSTNSGVDILFPAGLPASDTLRASQPGFIIAPNGTRTSFAANSQISSVPQGGAIALRSPGSISFASGSAPIAVSLPQGTYTTSGSDTLSTTNGNLELASSWDLSAYRFGDAQTGLVEPGILILRASGNLVFDFGASLSDGFSPASTAPLSPVSLWEAPLMPAGSQSWTYQLVAGADMSAADATQVMPASTAGVASVEGSVLLGAGATAIPTASRAVTRQSFFTANPDYYQTIRTGTGNIGVFASGDILLLDPLATIYTAGTQAPLLTGFDVPALGLSRNNNSPPTEPPFYPAQFTFGGGNVMVSSGRDIASYVQTAGGLAVDSPLELPDDWLYRRGSLAANGSFGTTAVNDVASTAWWVDFSNFFEGIGALGGGNVTLAAGRDIVNVDAAAPTNAQTASVNSSGSPLSPSTAEMIELGGGDVSVTAGNDISGGAYYVERGQGSLSAGNSILTNSARSTLTEFNISSLASQGLAPDPSTWMPTTLFLGQGSFNVVANGSVLLGPVANPFLLPQATDNGYYYKSYFSTYALSDSVTVFSTTGAVSIDDETDGGEGSLLGWISDVLFQPPAGVQGGSSFVAFSQPWLTIVETEPASFATGAGLMPPTLRATSFSGNINLIGNITLSPSPTGTLDLLAAGSVNGTQPNGLLSGDVFNATSNPYIWDASILNLSDASPSSVPGVASPIGFSGLPKAEQATTFSPFQALSSVLNESGATSGTNVVLQNEQLLHGVSPTAPDEPLHFGDPNPVHLYALGGNVSGFTLYSAKASQVMAGNDITDIGLYIQNTSQGDVSLVAAGRDIVAYDLDSPLRQEAAATGNELLFGASSITPGTSAPQSGDIQISGPGALEVLAGRNLSLGTGTPVTTDGLATGITSIGNTRNPILPFAGASIDVSAGIGPSTGIGSSALDFTAFSNEFLNPASSGSEGLEHLPELAAMIGVPYDATTPNASDAAVWSDYTSLTPSQRSQLALDMFYLVLRDAGRDRNNLASANYGNYNAGYEAVAALFAAKLDYTDANATGFVDLFLNPSTGGSTSSRYLKDLAPLVGDAGKTSAQVWNDFEALPANQQDSLALQIFGQVLADAAGEAGQPSTASAGNLLQTEALAALFNSQEWNGSISMSAHEIATTNGGNIDVLAPGGQITVGLSTDKQTPQVGILTEQGGNISIFSNGTVSLGTSRIFTLQGGNEVIWSSSGNIAAGSGSKTVHSAPPTRVLVNPQSSNVENDLAGLATGSGIGVLETLSTVPPGNVDLIAPVGIVDAGDAGIRASGNLNIAARLVLNANNIQVGGASVGLPPPPAAPNLAPLTAASAASAAASNSASEVTNQSSAAGTNAEFPSIITVDVLGYGGDDGDDTNPGDSANP